MIRCPSASAARIPPRRAGILSALAVALALAFPVRAGDLLRPNVPTSGGTSGTASQATTTAGAAGVPAAVAKLLSNSHDLLARTTAALAAVNQMQTAASALAASGSDSLRPGLPAVPANSYLAPNGLVPAPGVPHNLSNPQPGENPSLWVGSNLPQEYEQTVGGVTYTLVDIQQTQQQSVLNWQSFNVGKTTTLAFDQTLGGSDVGEWVVFNKIGVTGSPSQILGSITGQGQVYVINPNGIIFGGLSQVNAHALVASSLPINDNLITNGLLNNPDTQFLFSSLPIPQGAYGTPAFTPTMADEFVPNSAGTHTLALNVAANSAVTVTYVPQGMAQTALVPGTDYTYAQTQATASQGAQGVLTLTASGLQKVSGTLVSVAYTPAGDQYGNVEVQPGAQLTAPSNAGNVGGRVMLVGPNVTNNGTITTPDGQTILAAGLQVGIDAHPSTDPSLRGLDVFVGAVADPLLLSSASAGTATNGDSALIEAPRADVTLIGSTVNQLGFIDSSTSVSYNGRIDLLAEYGATPNAKTVNAVNTGPVAPPFDPTATGVVTLGAGSVTQILPDLSSTATIVGTQLALPSLIDIRGLAIHLASSSDTSAGAGAGAVIYAPSAGPTLDSTGTTVVSESNTRVPLTSGITLTAGDWLIEGPGGTNQVLDFINDRGQVYLDSGTTIDASGSENVSASVSEDIVAVQLRGTELANSPLQQNGPLRGQTVDVNLLSYGTYNGVPWVGSPIGDTSGYVGLIQRSVGELTTAGGSVSISAGNSVVIQPSATINVSGGWINYQGSNVTTTQVLAASGMIYDISEATPNRVYEGIYTGNTTTTDSKWNVTQTSASPIVPGTTFVPGYVQGGDAGAIAITAPAVAFDGQLLGNTVAGPYQRTSLGQVDGLFGNTGFIGTMQAILAVPTTGQLSLVFAGQDSNGSSVAPTPPNVVMTPPVGNPVAVAPFDFDVTLNTADLTIAGPRGLRGAEFDLSPELFSNDGFGIVSVDVSGGTADANGAAAGGTITVPQSTQVVAPPGASISLTAANIDIEGSISAPAGNIALTALDITPLLSISNTPPIDPTRGTIVVGGDASLSTAGLVVDDRPVAAAPLSEPLMTQGGKITISALNATFAPGSVLNASGGLDIQPTGSEKFGAGGAISILAGQDPDIPSVTGGKLALILDAGSLGTTLIGYAGPGAAGAALTIKAPLIQVGGSMLANGDAVSTGETLWINPTDPTTGSQLAPDFFSQGGFASFSLIGIGMADPNPNPVDVASPSMFPGVYIAPGTVATPISTVDTSTSTPVAPISTFVPTVIAPVAGSWVAVALPGNGGAFSLVPGLATLPVGQRTPVSLSFQAKGVTDPFNQGPVPVRGDLVVGAGAIIETDPQTTATGGVALKGDTVTVLGTVIAPGGTISVAGASSPSFLFGLNGGFDALPTVDLGPASLLDTQGTTVLTINPQHLRTGSVLPGGTIAISGNIVAESGATLNVSGWSDSNDAGGLLYVPLDESTVAIPVAGAVVPKSYVPYVVQSNGGTITLKGGQELYSDATLIGEAGGAFAQGGTLSVSAGRFYSPNNVIVPQSSDVSMSVTESGPTLPSGFTATGTAVLGNVVDPTLTSPNGPVDFGHFAASSLAGAGFDNVTIGGSFGATEFQGGVTLSANRSLVVANGGVISIVPTTVDTAPTVTLDAPYVAVGAPFRAPQTQWTTSLTPGTLPSFGSGSLVVNASDLIDVGDLSLQGVGTANLNAQGGDIRGNGTFDIMGTVTLVAAQAYPTTAGRFTVVAEDYTDANGAPQPGTVNIESSGGASLPQIPLSAGGQLDIYASDINQGGVLRAPIGTILLGWNGPGSSTADAAHIDQNTGQAVPTTQALNLLPGSVTTVSASDPVLTEIPYGINSNGTAWIDPNGNDITAAGVPGKTVSLLGAQIQSYSGSSVNVAGGGDLYAYQWISGTGGTNDVLSPNYVPNPSTPSLTSFAVIPGYTASYAPYAPYTTANISLLGSDPGYVTNTNGKSAATAPGNQVYLNGGAGLPAGTYTVLPARYALLPGAFLITPEAGAPPASAAPQPDGTTVVAGYLLNNLSPLDPGYHPVLSTFEVASGTVVRTESQYAVVNANTFLSQSALAAGAPAPQLPIDGGQLTLAADSTLGFKGSVQASAATGGTGGLVDIATSQTQNITIGATGPSGDLVLDPTDLSNFASASLLIGGTRQAAANGTSVSVTAGSINVASSGAPLTGSDVILAATNSITIGQGSVIEGTPVAAGSDETLLVTGNGVLVRATGDPSAQVQRTGVSGSPGPVLTLDSGSQVTGANVVLDSTAQTVLSPSAVLGGSGSNVTLGSGQISIQLEGAGPLRTQATGTTTTGLVLTSSTLQSLNDSVSGLALMSYSSIDVYGSGSVGSPTFSSITLSAPEIYGDGGNATFAAKTITLENLSNGTGPDSIPGGAATSGSLSFNAATFAVGAGSLNVQQYATLSINATAGMNLIGSSALLQQGALAITAPVVTAPQQVASSPGTAAQAAASVAMTAYGPLTLDAPNSGPVAPNGAEGLGAALALNGSSVEVNTSVYLPSGTMSAHDTGTTGATAVTIGSLANIDVGGTSKAFNDVTEYSNAGQISLTSDNGSVAVADGARLNLASQSGGGNAGLLSISAPNGVFSLGSGATLLGQPGIGGQAGSFSLDVSSIPGSTAGSSSLATLGASLAAADFTQSLGLRVRTGDVIVDGTLKAYDIDLSADAGSIDVAGTGTIDASGMTGGSIAVSATGSITLESGSLLTVKGMNFNDASQGGSVVLDAGAPKNGVITPVAIGSGPQLGILAGSTIDLSIVNNLPLQLNNAGSSITLPANTALTFPTGTPGDDLVTMSSAGSLMTPTGTKVSFAAGYTVPAAPGSVIVLSSPGTVTFATGGTGGAIPVSLPAGTSISTNNVTDLTSFNSTGTLTLEAPQAVDSAGNPVDVQVAPIGGTIVNPSSVVVAGFRTYNPTGGVIDTVESQILDNGAAFAGGIDSNNVMQTGHTADITQRLLASNPNAQALAAALHIEPGAEIVSVANPSGTTTLTLNNNGGSISVPSDVAINLPDGGSGIYLSSAGSVTAAAGTVTDPSGAVTALVAGAATPFAAGSTLSLTGSGAVTLASAGTLALEGGSGRLPVSLPGGATFTLGGADGTTVNAANGIGLTLSGAGSSIAANTGSSVEFPTGIPAGDTVEASQAGSVTSLTGIKTTFAAHSPLSLAPGSSIALKEPGTITLSNGSAAVAVLLSQGTYTTSGSDGLVTSTGNLVLESSWDLSTFRFGDPMAGSMEPGLLTLRATGDIVFNFGASLSDGFSPTSSSAPVSPTTLWTAPLLAAGSQSWSYQIVAGADFAAADPTQVIAQVASANPSAVAGSVLIGQGATAIPIESNTITRQTFFNNNPDFYQTIRTGTGSIGIYASGDVQLLNPLATIYTAGTQAPALADFDVPVLGAVKSNQAAPAEPPYYPAQFSFGGGDVAVSAGNNIASYLQTSNGLVVDSSMELPDNWLYRRGSLGTNGAFGMTLANDVASTAWWIDFSNFFEGVGALGGGNVTLAARNSVINVDAVAPTNARTTSVDSSGNALLPENSTTIELGGGDVAVSAGANISGGAYYVERGQGSLFAGGSILTNSARSTLQTSVLQGLAQQSETPDPFTWMPTTLFLGNGSFNVSANGNVLLGPVANPFLLPQATDNGFYYKSIFSTYSLADSVNVFSATGSVTVADSYGGGQGSLGGWIANILFQPATGLQDQGNDYISFEEPWLTLVETDVSQGFPITEALMPPSLHAVALSGDINIAGNLTLSPSPTGTIDLLAAGSINGTQPNEVANSLSVFNAASNPYTWIASVVNLSDASPASIPGVGLPTGFSAQSRAQQALSDNTTPVAATTLGLLFDESGATAGANIVLQNQQRLHGASPEYPGSTAEPLHYGDTNPVHLYALDGNISGFTLYSAKASEVVAGNDITDIALYIQNANPGDISVVAAGRDIIAYDLNSPLRQEAVSFGNELQTSSITVAPGTSAPQAGDIQVSGPGTLEVLAGRNLNLGTGSPTTNDGLATGITSIGNTRNPLLPFAGANLVVAAGVGASSGLDTSSLDFTTFANEFLNPATSGSQGLEHLPELAALLGVTYDTTNTAASDTLVWTAFNELSPTQQHLTELDLFYDVLRDAGRDRNNPASPNYGNYNEGYDAVAALFGAKLDYTDANGTGFVDLFLNPATGGTAATTYLNDLAPLIGDTGDTTAKVWSDYTALPVNQQQQLALQIFGLVLTDAATDAGQPATAAAGNLLQTEALASLFNGQQWNGSISTSAHEIATTNGGDVNILSPGGAITVGLSTDQQTPQVGILTEQGGNIAMFANGTVSLGTSRIFTLQGGNEIVWSSTGNIAAGSGSKTVHSAPPTRVLVNPQSANVENDLAGLATGAGIGVLETLSTVPPGNVDLIAPVGIVDAGDAGIRASGNLNIAARLVLNASNISVGGASVGLPPPPAAPNLAPLTAASAASAASASTAAEVTNQNGGAGPTTELPSIITVDILGYGGDEGPDSGDNSGTDNSPTPTPTPP